MAKIKKIKPERLEVRVSDIPPETFQLLKEAAKKNCRSMAKEVLYLIIEKF